MLGKNKHLGRKTCPKTKKPYKLIKREVNTIGCFGAFSGKKGTEWVCSECGEVVFFIGKKS